MTDTADLVKELRELADKLSGMLLFGQTSEAALLRKAAAALSERSTLQAELVEAKRERDEFRSALATASGKMAVLHNRVESAESSLTQAREAALEEAAKVADLDRTQPPGGQVKSHLLYLVRQRENIAAGIRSLKSTALAGEKMPHRQLFADMEEAWVGQKHYWRCKGCPDCQGIK